MKRIPLILLALCIAGVAAQADTWNVDQGGAGDFITIQQAIDAAESGDEIVVSPGTYVENINFLGKDLHIHSSDGPAMTVIDGGAGLPGSASCVTMQSGESLNAILQGFLLTGGLGSTYPGVVEETLIDPMVGGGVYCHNASGTIIGCRINENQTDYAAGIFVRNATMIITGCTFESNYAQTYASAVGGLESDVTIGGCAFLSNQAVAGDGAIHLLAPALISECVFRNNQARAGGAINVPQYGADLEIRNCIFQGNAATGTHGGAIRIHEAGPLVEDCLFIDNHAAVDGGGLLAIDGGSATIRNCTFHANGAGRHGGNIALYDDASPAIRNCIITGAAANGGLFCSFAYPSLYCNDVWGNTDGDYVGISDPTGADGNISADPLFCDPEAEDFSIDGESPCAPEHNPACGLIGAFGVGCDEPPTGTNEISWGGLKALFQ
ncbi:MAG: right-handed parallel beta-helix repeat-containing protein [Candidatus Eisenbacteria bacterium]